jgi:nucleotide-binding universal stress UspA family protein
MCVTERNTDAGATWRTRRKEMETATLSTPVILKTILFATDFSDVANRAQSYATALAKRFGAKLVIVHAKEMANYALPPQTWRSADEATALALRELKESLSQSCPDVASEFCVGEGSAWQVISAALGENKVDLMVLGTRGRTGLGKLLLGSQAEEIFRHASCPVLTVGPNSPEITGGEKEFPKVLYATDLSPESRAAAPYASAVALALRADLSLLHVVEDTKVGELVHPSELTSSSERLLRGLISEDASRWCQPRFFVETGEPAEQILAVAQHISASLIILGVREPKGVPGAAAHLEIGTAHKVIAAAKCPVLTVKH